MTKLWRSEERCRRLTKYRSSSALVPSDTYVSPLEGVAIPDLLLQHTSLLHADVKPETFWLDQDFRFWLGSILEHE